MNWSLSPYPYYHLVGVIIILTAAIFTWSRRQAHVARSLFYVLAAIWFYSFFAMLESAAVAIPTKIILSKLEYIGSTLSIPLMVSFSMQFVRPTLRPARWFIPLLSIIGLLFIVLVWSNEWHRLIWMDVVPGPPGTNSAIYIHGPLFYAFMAYIYLSVAGSGVLISRILFTLPRQYRSQAWIILVAVALPLLVMFLYVLELNPPGLDISPISFSLGGIVITLGIVRFGLFDLLPMARHTVIDAMKDGVIILDRRQRVVDFNPSAAGLLKMDPRMTGRPAKEILAQYPELLEQFATIKESPVEIRPTEVKPNWLEVRVLPMKSNTGYELGKLVLLRDISIRRSVEDQLRNANRQLLAQLDQIQSLQSMLQEQAVRDPLTGLFNRRYLEETLGREVARAERENYPISLILIDLDGFKGVNDSYGHLAGDAVLHGLGEMLLHSVRRGDIPCRLGGEEFLIIMPNAPAQIGYRRAEELRVRFSQNPVQFDGKALPATFSAGVASFPDHAPTTELLLRAADAAMYAAKQQGRNCVRLTGQ